MTRKVTLKRLMPESRMAMKSPSAICPGTVTAVYTRLLDKDRPECRILEDLAVVGQTGKGLLQHRGKAHVAQAHPEQADDRIDSEQSEDRQPRCQQKRDLRSLGTEFPCSHLRRGGGAIRPPPRKSLLEQLIPLGRQLIERLLRRLFSLRRPPSQPWSARYPSHSRLPRSDGPSPSEWLR